MALSFLSQTICNTHHCLLGRRLWQAINSREVTHICKNPTRREGCFPNERAPPQPWAPANGGTGSLGRGPRLPYRANHRDSAVPTIKKLARTIAFPSPPSQDGASVPRGGAGQDYCRPHAGPSATGQAGWAAAAGERGCSGPRLGVGAAPLLHPYC